MNEQIDKLALWRGKHAPRKGGLTQDECLALYWFRHHEKVPISVLSRAFRVSRNTIYYRAATGEADSYPRPSSPSATAKETRRMYEEIGPDEVGRRFVTKAQHAAVKYWVDAAAAKKNIRTQSWQDWVNEE